MRARSLVYSLIVLIFVPPTRAAEWLIRENIAGVAIVEGDIRRERPRLLMTARDLPAIRARMPAGFVGSAPNRYQALRRDIKKQWNQAFDPARQGDRLMSHALVYALGPIKLPKAMAAGHSIEEIGRKGVEFLKLSAAHWDKHSAENGYATYALLPVCWAYDWLYSLLSAEDRKEIVGELISAAYNQKRNAQQCTFKDYSLAAHNYVAVALAIAGDNVEIDHVAGWDAKQRYSGNSDRYVRELLGDLNGIYLNRFYAGWKFATQGGGQFQGVMNHFGDVMMLAEVLRAAETATGKDLLSDLEYLTAATEWFTYAQIPEYEYTDAKGKRQTMKGLMFGTDDENPYTSFWWPQEVGLTTSRFAGTQRAELASWFIRNYVPEYRRLRYVPDLIFHDESIAPKSAAELKLPLTRHFGLLAGKTPPGTPPDVRHPAGAGIVVMRGSWTDPAATLAVFKCRSWQFTHDHPDSNSFIIFKKGYLAIDSGRYQNGDWKPEEANYDYRTIAHNTMLVFDPDEKFGEKGEYANDGGQRMRDGQRDYPEDYVVGGRKDVGGLARLEAVAGQYDYMLGDATRAYNSTLFALKPNRPKVSLAQRAFVYLRSPDGERDFFVVFDRVTSTNASFEKRWLLHSVERPEIDGKWSEGGVDGKGASNPASGTPGSISTDSSIVTISENQGKLFCQTLLPEKHRTILRGGPNAQGVHAEPDSYEYLDATGKQWPLDKKYTVTTYIRECGNFRVEIIPQEARTDDVFLHVLHPAGAAKMPPAQAVKSDDGSAVGACVDGWCVVFGAGCDFVGETGDTGGRAAHPHHRFIPSGRVRRARRRESD